MSKSSLLGHRAVFLISYPSPLFASHWATWIPEPDKDQVGKLLHVVGSAAEGFKHEFKRNYDLNQTRRKYSMLLLGEVDAKHVVDVNTDGEISTDDHPYDDLEKTAVSVPPPEKSLGSGSLGKKVIIKDCQTWMWEFVEKLVTEHILPQSALDVLKTAPKN